MVVPFIVAAINQVTASNPQAGVVQEALDQLLVIVISKGDISIQTAEKVIRNSRKVLPRFPDGLCL